MHAVYRRRDVGLPYGVLALPAKGYHVGFWQVGFGLALWGFGISKIKAEIYGFVHDSVTGQLATNSKCS